MPVSLESRVEGFSLPGGLVMSCNALRDVRTFRWILDVDAGVKNFLNRLGVIVGGLIGFLGTFWLVGQTGDEAGQLRLPVVSDMAIGTTVIAQ